MKFRSASYLTLLRIFLTKVLDERAQVAHSSMLSYRTIPHHYYLVDSGDYRFPGSSAPLELRTANFRIPPNELFQSAGSGRSVDVGQIFDDSRFPDIAVGMSEGAIHLFANLGVDEDTGQFLGFDHRGWITVQAGCVIRDIMVASLSPCTTSLVTAVTCGTHSDSGLNRVYTLPSALNCPDAEGRNDNTATHCSSKFGRRLHRCSS